MQEKGIKQEQVSERTVCRYLNAHGYFYLQSKQKGFMTGKDMQLKLSEIFQEDATRVQC